MNNKITFPKLASLLADKSGRSKRFSEDFLRELFAIISEQLEAGESVKVKGLGTFRLMRVEPRKSVDVTTGLPMEISGHSKVVFTPAKELAEAINAPFEAFTPIEIGEDVDLDKIAKDADVEVRDDSEEILLSAGEQLIREVPAPAEHVSEAETAPAEPAIDEVQVAAVPVIEKEHVDPDHMIEEVPEAKVNLIYPENRDDEITIIDGGIRYDEDSKYGDYGNYDKGTPGWVRTILISVSCAALAVAATFLIWSILTKPDFKNVNRDADYLADYEETNGDADFDGFATDDDASSGPEIELPNDEESLPANSDDVPTTPSDALVYDTIGVSRYLTTMAKDHYGNNKFWPYIYEENKSRIGHPDKIRPGTPIVIPSLSKYGVDPSNPDDMAKANKLGAEIYARYGKTL